ncbi:unnamed protein product [Ectocarpus sp. 4 AP-2014]
MELSVPDKLQTLKDYRLTIEYKHLKQNAPGGVFVIPSVNHLRIWYGVIFVRRGHYANGVFKFRVELPPDYNDAGTWPIIRFTSSVFNPMVSPITGELDLRSVFPEWLPGKHYMVTALTYLKKVFYMKDFSFPRPANPEAQALFQDDKRGFLERVEACVRESQETVYENEEGSSLRFTEPKAAHDKLREKILGTDQAGTSSLSPAGTRELKVSTAATTGAGEGSTEADRAQEHSGR